FGDSYQAPPKETGKGSASESFGKKKGMTVAITTEDMQKRRNYVKARTTLLLALPDEHQLRFSKYETAQELWGAILKTFGRNEATKKTKKNQLKQQYGNFKAEASETLEKGEVHTASVLTASTQVSTASTDVAAASISHDTVCAYIASQSNGSQIKYKDITQIDKDDIEEMDIKWNMALLSMRADRFWKKTGKKITIQGSDVASFDKSKMECLNYHKMGHFTRECRAPRSQDRADCPGVIKTNKTETARKSPVKYAEMYKNTSKSPKVRGHSNVKRHFQGKSAVITQSRVPRVSTADLGNKGKAVKAPACWIWRPKQNTTKKGKFP
nr:hypothetical protein [Tanacetum cinerariifolium]